MCLSLHAGRASLYPQYSIPLAGCRPANSSSWVNFPGDNFMYRLFVTKSGWNWFTWTNEAALYGGIIWVPRTRQRQVGPATSRPGHKQARPPSRP